MNAGRGKNQRLYPFVQCHPTYHLWLDLFSLRNNGRRDVHLKGADNFATFRCVCNLPTPQCMLVEEKPRAVSVRSMPPHLSPWLDLFSLRNNC
ncbi:hypothetical protein CEXT_55691 [Caerostris extrusa]|uniref:Uncharacterized protein n=1 Tax=Caerostris extrusa TaxID=172846 RepID=A0AAV4MBG7_CAEEX|nr:hypothetical protein CEXT_55691 [Caerostris extrusa]